jgi:hypothetical protein
MHHLIAVGGPVAAVSLAAAAFRYWRHARRQRREAGVDPVDRQFEPYATWFTPSGSGDLT